MTDSEERSIGRLEAQVAHLTASVAQINHKLDAIQALVDRGAGAKWAIGLIAAVVGSIASFLLAAFSMSRTS